MPPLLLHFNGNSFSFFSTYLSRLLDLFKSYFVSAINLHLQLHKRMYKQVVVELNTCIAFMGKWAKKNKKNCVSIRNNNKKKTAQASIYRINLHNCFCIYYYCLLYLTFYNAEHLASTKCVSVYKNCNFSPENDSFKSMTCCCIGINGVERFRGNIYAQKTQLAIHAAIKSKLL